MSNEKTVQYALRYHKDSPYFFNPNENGEGCSGSTDDPEKAFRYDSIREAKNALLRYVKSTGTAMKLALDAEIVRLTHTTGPWEIVEDPNLAGEENYEYGCALFTGAGYVNFAELEDSPFTDDVVGASIFPSLEDMLIALQHNVHVSKCMLFDPEDPEEKLEVVLLRRPAAGWQVEHIDE